MRDTIMRVGEAIGLRALPGLVNLANLLLIADWLSAEEYGLYSTTVTTSGFVASVVFGPLTYAIVSQHARLEARGQADAYESAIVSGTLLITILSSALGAAAAYFELTEGAWIAPAVTFGAYTTVQEILHARLRLWTYGFASLGQSVALTTFFWIFVRPNPGLDTALATYSASYALAAVFSAYLSGFPSLRWPDLAMLFGTFRVGVSYTLASLIENGIFLGVRYLIMLMGTPRQLGVFSFCVDLAQRSIGFLINAASFVIIPAAFKNEAKDNAGFTKMLLSGVVLGTCLSGGALLVILALRSVVGWPPALVGILFDPMTFVIVSAAGVVNRVKKMLVDSIAMRVQMTNAIAIGYAISAPLTLGAVALSYTAQAPHFVAFAYLGGYVLAGAVTIAMLATSKKKGISTKSRKVSS